MHVPRYQLECPTCKRVQTIPGSKGSTPTNTPRSSRSVSRQYDGEVSPAADDSVSNARNDASAQISDEPGPAADDIDALVEIVVQQHGDEVIRAQQDGTHSSLSVPVEPRPQLASVENVDEVTSRAHNADSANSVTQQHHREVPQQAFVICQNCQTSLPVGFKFCNECGCQVRSHSEDPPEELSPQCIGRAGIGEVDALRATAQSEGLSQETWTQRGADVENGEINSEWDGNAYAFTPRSESLPEGQHIGQISGISEAGALTPIDSETEQPIGQASDRSQTRVHTPRLDDWAIEDLPHGVAERRIRPPNA